MCLLLMCERVFESVGFFFFFFLKRLFASVGMSSDEEAHISAPEPKRPATGDAEKQQQPDMNDVHFTHHEGTTRFFVVYNKKPIPLFFNLVSCHTRTGTVLSLLCKVALSSHV